MKMEFERFNEWIQARRELWAASAKIRSFGVELEGVSYLFQAVLNPLDKTIFNELQRDTLDWWLYECPEGIQSNPGDKAVMRWVDSGERIPLGDERELYDYLLTLEEA